jgi:hypothetical protein
LTRLKILTSASLILGFCGLLLGPWMLQMRPRRGAEPEAFVRYAWLASGYLGVMLIAFVAASVGAFLIVRRTRDEFAQQSKRNLTSLIEGTQSDIQRESRRDDG